MNTQVNENLGMFCRGHKDPDCHVVPGTPQNSASLIKISLCLVVLDQNGF